MSPRLFRGEHERATELAAARLAEPLEPGDRDWLDAHLGWCAPCRAVADEYEAQRLSLRALRHEAPAPPRDLWARTAAALDAEAGRHPATRPLGSRAPRFRPGGLALAPLAAVLVVAVVVGSSLLNGIPFGGRDGATPGQDAAATPIAVAAGEVQIVSRAADGTLRLSTGRYDEVCPVGSASCGTVASIDDREVAKLAPDSIVDALISPARDQLVVVDRTAGNVYVYDVGPAATAEPLRTLAATTEPTPATPSPTPEATPAATDEPSPEPTTSVEPTLDATPSPSIEPTPEPTPEPTATVRVTPAPGGMIEIASDVVVVGSVTAYSPDGRRFAFTARPVDGSAGPDVYVWRTSEKAARAITDDHASLFASWMGDRLLVSRVVDGSPRTFLVHPVSGAASAVRGGAMWRPSVDPAGRVGVWWDGTVEPSSDGFGWRPADGRLVVGAWPGADAGIETRPLTTRPVGDWQVRWDDAGTVLALWIEEPDAEAGRLSLFAVDPGTGAVDLATPLLEDEPALAGFSLRTGRLAWAAPADDGGTTVEVVTWTGNRLGGQLQLATEDGVTVVR